MNTLHHLTSCSTVWYGACCIMTCCTATCCKTLQQIVRIADKVASHPSRSSFSPIAQFLKPAESVRRRQTVWARTSRLCLPFKKVGQFNILQFRDFQPIHQGSESNAISILRMYSTWGGTDDKADSQCLIKTSWTLCGHSFSFEWVTIF